MYFDWELNRKEQIFMKRENFVELHKLTNWPQIGIFSAHLMPCLQSNFSIKLDYRIQLWSTV